jgi:hypothetical protein
MDCHDNNSTTWKLMGVFKEASYFGNDAFFEQLFKHEGVCLWNDDDLYEFMSEARQGAWTEGCVSTGIQAKDDYSSSRYSKPYLYIDLKPTWNGNMTYGLYIDSACKTEYSGFEIDVEDVAKNMGLLYGDYLQQWNDALEVYKVCQPCRAYNLKNNYQSYNYRRLDEDEEDYEDPNDGYFQCDDDADYTNVNQCMKFRTHAELEVATWEDLVTATNQGGILQVNVGGTIFGSERMSAEQMKYMETLRKSELKKEAKQAAEDAKQINAMKPASEAWEQAGHIAIAVGAFTLALVFCRVIYRACKNRSQEQQQNFSEPLLTPVGFL